MSWPSNSSNAPGNAGRNQFTHISGDSRSNGAITVHAPIVQTASQPPQALRVENNRIIGSWPQQSKLADLLPFPKALTRLEAWWAADAAEQAALLTWNAMV